MKKSLLFLSSVAVLSSCSDEIMDNVAVKDAAQKGIRFAVVDEATRGQFTPGSHLSSFFYAESDNVAIYANGAKANLDAPVAANNFDTKYVYKATRSGSQDPLLTGVDNANILMYDGAKKAQFFVTYPKTNNVSYDAVNDKFNVTPAYDLVSQSMDKGIMNFNSRILTYYTGDKAAVNAWDGVGETLDVHMTSPLSMLYFKINDYEKYKDSFGKLSKITVESVGAGATPLSYAVAGGYYTAEEIDDEGFVISTLEIKKARMDNDDIVAPSDIISLGGSEWVKSTLTVGYEINGTLVYIIGNDAVKVYDKKTGTKANVGDARPTTGGDVITVTKTNANKVTRGAGVIPQSKIASLNITNTTWSNTMEGNLFVLPKTTTNDNYSVIYNFEKVDLRVSKKSTGVWEAGKTYGMPSTDGMNIAQNFPYIVTKGTSGTVRTLIFNTQKVANAFNAAGNVIWYDTFDQDGIVEQNKIDEIIINADVDALEAADWTALNNLKSATKLTILNGTTDLVNVKNMTSLKKVTANKVTTVKSGAFGTNAANITDLNLAAVTSYKDNKAFESLVNLNLGSYNFEVPGEEVAPLFFNNNVKLTLVTVDIHSVESLAPKFGYERNILFTDYNALKTVKLNATKTIISANEFNDCDNLETVTGVVEMSTADHAFYNCPKLKTVNMFGTEIPAYAFANETANTGVENVKVGGVQVVPTYVGKAAFENNKSIKLMDLTNLEGNNLKAYAFNNAINFAGNADAIPVVTLNISDVPAYAFNNTAVIRFQLKKAKTTQDRSLNSAVLKQIKYRQENPSHNYYQVVDRKSVVDIFVKTVADADLFNNEAEPYATVTKEDSDW